MGGDLGNEVTPRLLIAYEDVLVHPQPVRRRRVRGVRWEQELASWPVNGPFVAVLWQVVARLGVRFDAVTFLPPEAVPHIREHLDQENVPVSHVRAYESPQALATALAYQPDVIGVYDRPDRAIAYGGLGQDMTQLGRLL